MTQPSLCLAELLCARLCHELASPLGTLAGVMEMQSEGGAAAAEARSVATEAAASVRARLRLLRAAWSSDCGAMTVDELRSMAAGLRAGRRVSVSLDDLTGEFSGAQARVLLNVMLLAVEAVAGSGVVTLSGSGQAGVEVRLSGSRAEWPAAFAGGLADKDAAWAALSDPRTVQGPFTAIIMRQTETQAVLESLDEVATLRLAFR